MPLYISAFIQREGGLSRRALPRLEAMDDQPSPIYTLDIQVPALDTGNQILRTTEDSRDVWGYCFVLKGR